MISTTALRNAGVGADEDPGLVEGLIARATEFIQRQTGRYFGEPAEVTEYLIGNGSRLLRLPEPVTDAIPEVEERCYPGADPTVIDNTGFELRTTDGTTYLVRKSGCWKLGYEYAVTMARGYEVDEGPKDIEQLIIDLVALRLANREREGLSGEQIGGYSYTKPALHAFENGDLRSIVGGEATIRAWRRPVFA